MKSASKLNLLLASGLLLTSCGQIENSSLPTNDNTVVLGTSFPIDTAITETIENFETTIPDITPYISSLTNEEINNNISMYLFDMEFYTPCLNLIKEGACKDNIDYAIFSTNIINKKYQLDLNTDYPIVDEYYKMIDSEAKQKLSTLSYVDGKATFTYEPYPNHNEIEKQFNDFLYNYYIDVTDEKIQSLNYPFKEIIVDNTISNELFTLEKECMEKYTYHYNGLRYATFRINGLNMWGEDAYGNKEYSIATCYKTLCRMKNFTEQYQNVVGENPEDIILVNEYIEKYSNAYMYVLKNADNMTDDEVYTYLHNFLFDEEMIDLQTKVYHIEQPNPTELLTIVE